MQTAAPGFAILLALMSYSVFLWIIWKFYHALARIGEELSEIKTVLLLRLPPPERPGDANASSPQSANP
jgi:hypothetical protein